MSFTVAVAGLNPFAIVFALLLLAAPVYWFFSTGTQFRPTGLVTEAVSHSRDRSMNAIEPYSLRATVLSVAKYSDAGAKWAPFDFALAWGELGDHPVLGRLHVRQMGRFYSWWTDDEQTTSALGGEAAIVRESANVHVVPANQTIRNALEQFRRGDVIELRGHLVDIVDPTSNFRWFSSRSREDTGSGSCELFLVESAQSISIRKL